jgi:hypothetical protein
MSRVNVYEDGVRDAKLTGWFDTAAAENWRDQDHNGNGSGGTGRGTALWHTSQERWVLENWTSWQDERSTYQFIEPEQAREWLIRNEEDSAVARYFGPLEEEADLR